MGRVTSDCRGRKEILFRQTSFQTASKMCYLFKEMNYIRILGFYEKERCRGGEGRGSNCPRNYLGHHNSTGEIGARDHVRVETDPSARVTNVTNRGKGKGERGKGKGEGETFKTIHPFKTILKTKKT